MGLFFAPVQNCPIGCECENYGSKLLGAKMGMLNCGIQWQMCLSSFSANGGICLTSSSEKEAAGIITSFREPAA